MVDGLQLTATQRLVCLSRSTRLYDNAVRPRAHDPDGACVGSAQNSDFAVTAAHSTLKTGKQVQ